MLKKKYMILVVLGFCLVATLFVGVTISQNGALESTTPQKGYVSVPAAAFVPYDEQTEFRISDALYSMGDFADYYGSVQLPDGATVTNMTCYWYDNDPNVMAFIDCYLRRYNQTSNWAMASCYSHFSPGNGFSYAHSIVHATVDNSKYAYYLYVIVAQGGTLTGLHFKFAVIEYEYPTPPITPETMYPDASTWVNLDELPGTRINLPLLNDIEINTTDTTHIWHGFVSDGLWVDMTVEEQTEFLSTTEFRFFVNDEQVSLRHILRLDESGGIFSGHMWSIYYKVFPQYEFHPQTHRVRGEWYELKNGVWGNYMIEGDMSVGGKLPKDPLPTP